MAGREEFADYFGPLNDVAERGFSFAFMTKPSEQVGLGLVRAMGEGEEGQ